MQLWELRDGDQEPIKTSIGSHTDWVRDVAWCPNIGLMNEMIASCSEDGSCKVWVSQNVADQANKSQQTLKWALRQEIRFDENVPLWKVSWSQVGNMLAISGGDNQVRIMSENSMGVWDPKTRSVISVIGIRYKWLTSRRVRSRVKLQLAGPDRPAHSDEKTTS